MRQIFIFCFVGFFACTKNSQPPPAGTISFDANGQHIQYDATGGKIISVFTTYTLTGANGLNNLINLQIYTDSLRVQQYEIYRADHPPPKGEAMLDINGQFYTSFDSTQKITVNITRHSGGIVNATFSGLLVWPKDGIDLSKGIDSAVITNGQINNVSMIY